MPEWLKYPITLLIVAALSAFLLAGLEKITRPQKEKLAIEEEALARKLVLPNAATFKSKVGCEIGLNSGGEVVGYVAKGEAVGYSSTIKLMVGANQNLEVKGIKVLYQKETPGLGDKILEIKSKKTWWTVITGKEVPTEKPWFTEQFIGKSSPFKVTKDGGQIDAITGATISSRAVCRAVNNALDAIKKCAVIKKKPPPTETEEESKESEQE